jgi:cytidine deaminase
MNLPMKFKELTDQDLELIEKAKSMISKRKSKRSSVAAALRTKNNKIFTGINIDIEASAPCSICAEYAAIAAMATEGEQDIETIVAVSCKNNYAVLPPCGKCRQLIKEFGNPYVIVEVNHKLKKVRLNQLYPLPVISK